MSNPIIEEYVELWHSILAQKDEYLPHVVDSGLATMREKISVDVLDLIVTKLDELSVLKKQLKQMDAEYSALLAELKQQQQKQAEESDEPVEPMEYDERGSRIADFLFGLVTSLNRDFSKSAGLEYIVQQIYLFAGRNSG